VLDRATWTSIAEEGGLVDPRRGDHEDPLAGVVHILLADSTDIDVILAKWKWEAAVIDRAELMSVRDGVTIRVPTLSDLILLKLAAGGFRDLQDAAALLQVGDRQALVNDVESRIRDVRPDVQDVWRDLIARTQEP
jgi:hypothetical protein